MYNFNFTKDDLENLLCWERDILVSQVGEAVKIENERIEKLIAKQKGF
tara:strand:- start:149 stop:292 length:144 start_codon:yes stop_codon:yes gene_type:complete